MRRVLGAIAVLLAGVCFGQPTKEGCASASEEAQRLRTSGKLLQARAEAVKCAREECPKVVRSFCDGLLTEISQSLPTVVLAVRDEKGRDIADAQVFIDSDPPERPNGLPRPIDPGPHRFRVESADRAPVELDVVVLIGDRNRVVALEVGAVRAPVHVAEPVPLSPALSPTRGEGVSASRRSISPGVWASAGVAVAGFAVSLGLILSAKADESRLRSTCAPACEPDALEPMRAKGYASTAAFSLALTAAIVAVVLFFWRPGES